MTVGSRLVWRVGILLVAVAIWWTATFFLPRQRVAVRAPTASRTSNSTQPPIWVRGANWPATATTVPDTFFFPEIMGAGCALLDYDRDGDLDIYIVQGAGARPAGDSPAGAGRNRLMRQVAAGSFEDVSKGSGLDVADVGMGVAVGDVNNDGWPDVYLANYAADRLLLNHRDGTFADVTQQAGIDDLNWGASACFLDYDRDGWLDLCVVNYLDYDPGHRCPDAEGQLDYCNPKLFAGVAARLYRNTSGGKQPGMSSASHVEFQNVSWDSGIGKLKGPGLGVVSADFNGDDWPDLYVANDGAANYLWLNQRDGTFKEQAVPLSAAYDNQGRPQASMGIALGDPDFDGDADLLVTHLRGENNALYLSEPAIGFSEQSSRAGLALPSFPFTGFGTAFVDFDLDGDLDVAVANGAVRRPHLGMYAQTRMKSAADFWKLYSERNQIFINGGVNQFQEVSAESQPFCERLNVARGLATGDIDNDGDVDLLVSDADGGAQLYLNEAPRKGHWLVIQAVEPRLGGRDSYGARITVTSGARRWTGWVNAGGSYLSSSDSRVHFGLGDVKSVDSIQVVWPNGDRETFPAPAIDRLTKLAHGEGKR